MNKMVVGTVFLSLLISTSVQADSLLAPLVINTANYDTYFAFKIKGATNSDSIHYTWLKKGTTLADLSNLEKTCLMENNMGKGSKGDMVFQNITGAKQYYNGSISVDGSSPAGYNAGDFVGMTVIDDVSDLNEGHSVEGGGSSGFVYIVDRVTGLVQDYKMLNNHKNSKTGDFSTGFISKHVVDFSWMSTSTLAPVAGSAPSTEWFVSVAGPDMSKHAGTYNSTYGLTVKISQAQRSGEDSPQAVMGGGAVNNDEKVISGDKAVNVTCMGRLDPTDILTPSQLVDLSTGGWVRKSIIPLDDMYAGADSSPKIATGAIVYRVDKAIVPASLAPNGTFANTSMQIETGGHLAKSHNHANRPY